MVVLPGAFDLWERGELDPASPRFADLPMASRVRIDSRIETSELRSRWQAFLDRLQGYQRDRVLLDRVPVWVPIVELFPPPDGQARIAYSRQTEISQATTLKILGVGHGDGLSATLMTEIEFNADAEPLALCMPVLVTATRYLRDSGQAMVRWDVHPGGPETKLSAVSPRQPPVILTSPHYEVVETLRLADAPGQGSFSWTRRAAQRASWQFSVAPALPALATELQLGVEMEGSEAFEVTFALPFGRDYVLYYEVGVSRVAPQCMIARAAA
jgi:hypothetical protein